MLQSEKYTLTTEISDFPFTPLLVEDLKAWNKRSQILDSYWFGRVSYKREAWSDSRLNNKVHPLLFSKKGHKKRLNLILSSLESNQNSSIICPRQQY